MKADGRRSVRVALGFALVIASCPVISKLATLGTRPEAPAVVTVPQPVTPVVRGEPRPPWESLPPGRMVIYMAGGRVVLDAARPSKPAKR
ncbi:MAG TPA: hypothetical protein VM076_09625 [Gemmatimonadaceae bacterium]|nr:hypothetical protein [Gemmatimonadaceae bacterium]